VQLHLSTSKWVGTYLIPPPHKGAITLIDKTTGNVDFHLHWYASKGTDYYAANAFSIPESHSDPSKLYPMQK